MNVSSPCIGVCRLDDKDICLGCFRSRNEIAQWTQMTCSEQLFVIAALDNRRKELCCSEMNGVHYSFVQEVKAT